MGWKETGIAKELAKKSFFLRKVYYSFQNGIGLQQNSDLFRDAVEIWFYAGELFPEFYLDSKVMANVDAALKKDCHMEVLFGPALYIESWEFLRMAFASGKAKIYMRRYRNPAHFKLIRYADGRELVIFDDPHQMDANDNERRSTILWKGFDKEVDEFRKKFELEKSKAILLTLDNICEEFKQTGFEKRERYGLIKRDSESRIVKAATKAEIEGFCAKVNSLKEQLQKANEKKLELS